MFEVRVSGRFVASHRVRRPDGSYEDAHEHEWHVCATYAGRRLNESGLLVDFAEVERHLAAILGELHGRELNHTPAFADRSPSAENVALHVAERLRAHLPDRPTDGPVLRCVEVEEAPGCFARYFPASSECVR